MDSSLTFFCILSALVFGGFGLKNLIWLAINEGEDETNKMARLGIIIDLFVTAVFISILLT